MLQDQYVNNNVAKSKKENKNINNLDEIGTYALQTQKLQRRNVVRMQNNGVQ